MRLYSGWGTRRLTSTTMVFCILVETTSPIFSFFNPCLASVGAILLFLSRKFPLTQHGVDARPVFLHHPDLLQSVHLSHGHLKLEAKKLLIHFVQLMF